LSKTYDNTIDPKPKPSITFYPSYFDGYPIPVQLLLVGYVLATIFQAENAWIMMLISPAYFLTLSKSVMTQIEGHQ
jgi:ABC-type enterochelin transport system permease subunit